MQCLHCGYSSADKFKGNKTNPEYEALSEDMKKMVINQNTSCILVMKKTLKTSLKIIKLTLPLEKQKPVVKKPCSWK